MNGIIKKTAALLFFFSVITLSGCANQSELNRAYQAQEANVASQTTMTHYPICDFSCGTVENPCQNVALKCYTARAPVVIPKITGTNDVVIKGMQVGLPVISSGVKWFSVYKIFDSAAGSFGGGNTTTSTTTNTLGDNNVSTPTTSITSSSADYNQANSTTGDQANYNTDEANDNTADNDSNNSEANPIDYSQANPIDSSTDNSVINPVAP